MKNCINCSRALVLGTNDCPKVSCKSPDYTHRNNFNNDERCAASYCDGYDYIKTIRGGSINLDGAFQFILAGKSEFILHSTKTNDDFKFNIVRVDSKREDTKYMYFVYSLLGNNKIYGGVMWLDSSENIFKYSTGKKGTIDASDIKIRSLLLVLNRLYNKESVQYLEVYSLGKCGACGKALSNTKEMSCGLDSNCIKNIDIPHIDNN